MKERINHPQIRRIYPIPQFPLYTTSLLVLLLRAYGGATSSIRFPNVKFFVCFLNGSHDFLQNQWNFREKQMFYDILTAVGGEATQYRLMLCSIRICLITFITTLVLNIWDTHAYSRSDDCANAASSILEAIRASGSWRLRAEIII